MPRLEPRPSSQTLHRKGRVALSLNRSNDSMAAPLEPVPTSVAAKALAAKGWTAGKHGR